MENFRVSKALISYILCKILSLKPASPRGIKDIGPKFRGTIDRVMSL